MKKFILCLALFTFSASLSACETVKGVGKDLENAGEKIQEL